jgi:hypothetical protein
MAKKRKKAKKKKKPTAVDRRMRRTIVAECKTAIERGEIVDADFSSAKSVRNLMEAIGTAKVALPWAEGSSYPPEFVRRSLDGTIVGTADPFLGDYQDPHNPRYWGWQCHFNNTCAGGTRLARSKKAAMDKVDEWLRGYGFTLLEDD